MFGGTEWADKWMFVALWVEADEIDFLSLMSLFFALDIFDDVAGYLLFHMTKIYI